MTSFQGTVAFIIFNFPIFINASYELCIVYPDGDRSAPLDQVVLHHCESSYQECCSAGCCEIKKNDRENFLWLLMVVLVAAFAYMMRQYCRKYCCNNERRIGDDATRSHTIFDEDGENRPSARTDFQGDRSYQHPTVDINVATNLPQAAPSTSNTHPITPPPPYDVAVLTPPNPPVLPEDRIPTYEDVIKGKLK